MHGRRASDLGALTLRSEGACSPADGGPLPNVSVHQVVSTFISDPAGNDCQRSAAAMQYQEQLQLQLWGYRHGVFTRAYVEDIPI